MVTKRTTIEVPSTLSLASLQTHVQDHEGILGPLIGLGARGMNNALTFSDGVVPDHRAVLEIFRGSAPKGKLAHVLICSSLCWVEGKGAKVAAYRPF